MVKVLIKKLFPGVQLPSYKTSGASGMDLIAFIESTIKIEPKTSPIDETLSTEDQETLVSEAIDKPWKVLYEISHKIVHPKS